MMSRIFISAVDAFKNHCKKEDFLQRFKSNFVSVVRVKAMKTKQKKTPMKALQLFVSSFLCEFRKHLNELFQIRSERFYRGAEINKSLCSSVFINNG